MLKQPLADFVDVNPKPSLNGLTSNSPVSFIPMSDATEAGVWVNRQTRKLKEVQNGYTPFQEGDILFAKITPCMENGKGCHATQLRNGVGFGSTEFHVLRAKAGVSPRFIFQWLQSPLLRLKAEAEMTGSAGQRRVQASFFERFTIPRLDFREQQQVAEILDTIDEAIYATRKLISKLENAKNGLLHDLLTKGLDETGNLRDPERRPEAFRDTAIGKVPNEWDVARLLDYVALPSGQLDPKVEPYRNWVLIAPDHIESRTGRLIITETAAQQNAISGKYAFQNGDVLYSKIRPYLRKAVLAKGTGLCSADMYPLRPTKRLIPRYLMALVLGENFSRFATSVSERSGFPKINREELGEYITALPQPEEQQQICEILEAYDERAETEEMGLCKLEHLKKGLMDDLLTGRVRVAEALRYLERVL